MMKFSILWVSLLALLLLSGCSFKSYEITETKIITFKTEKLRFNDLGYVRRDGDSIQVELFSAGHAIAQMEINHLICIRKGCMSKSSFNSEYLHADYPDDLMQNIFLSRPIFEGKNLTEHGADFEQSLESPSYTISYRVNAQEIYFKDKLNGIMIRIKTIKK